MKSHYHYDVYGRVLTRTDGSGTVQEENRYLPDGRLAFSREADGQEIRYTYGAHGREEETSTARSRKAGRAAQKYRYDSRGRITGVVNGNGNETGYDLDAWGRIQNIRQADGGEEGYTYDFAGNVTGTRDANGGVITYRYNSQGKVCEITDQEGNSETFRYDREGRMVLHVDRNGSEVRTTYNVDGNPVLETGTDRNGENRVTRSFEYDASGNVRKAVAGGFCYTYEYRPDGKLLKKSASGRTLVSCTYFSDGSLESLTDASGKPVFYEYDWRGNLSAVKDGNGETLAAYAHTPGGRLKEIRHGNGIRTGYEYDTDGNLVHLHMEHTDGEILADLYYSHDLNGNRTLKSGSRIGGAGKATEHKISYVYDRMDRLVTETRQGEETAYVYDLCGNRLKKLDKSGTEEYHYNRKNQLICRFSEKDKTAYCYDKQGNLLEAAGAEGTAVFSYNAFHQQTAVTMPDGKHLENRYDAEYLRAGMVENGTVATFSYHNGELLAESSPEGDTISRYIPGYGVAAGWNRERSGYHYYHLDEQNSTAYITGSSGEIENRYEYDAFGVLQDSREELRNRILYTGQQYDQTSGQYYLRARFYNPVLGRFVQEDVYRGDGLNLYAYCRNNPVVYYDPSGYDSQYPCKEETSAGESGRGESGDSPGIKVASYNNMRNDPNVTGQSHHLSQNAVFKNAIPQGDGLCVELNGNAFSEIGSPHYEAHNSLERFWNQYRPGGGVYREYPTIGEYNRAVYDSLLSTDKFTPQEAAYAVRKAYEQQRSVGFMNSDFVPRIPGKLPQKK